ncbi:MAG: hypothetical protein WBC44_15925 [Planctomycetaceae bacterium]
MNTDDSMADDSMSLDPDGADQPLGETIVGRVEAILTQAEQSGRPIEVNPFRGRLFELFVTADAAGYLREDSDVDLTSDGLCRRLGERWGLADATRDSVERQQKLPPEHLAKMRLLWSVLRMWMEWQYAWDRWPEFHRG